MNTYKKAVFPLTLVTLLALAIVGLSSWKSPQPKKSPDDTTRKSGKKEAKYSKKTIITFDENGKPHEEIVEDFEGDESLRKLFNNDRDFDFDFDFPPMPEIPDLDINIPDFPHNFMPPIEGFDGLDTLDFGRFHLEEGRLELLNENMEEMMQEKFETLGPEFEARMEAMEEQLKALEFNSEAFDEMGKNLEEKWSHIDKSFDRDFNLQMERLQEELSHLEQFNEGWESQIKEFEKAAREELIKDGYLKPNEKIENMQWSDEEIKFNEKIIKKEHHEKYRDLKEKYWKRNRYRGRPE